LPGRCPFATHHPLSLSALLSFSPLSSGRLECAKALLRAGADPNHATAGGDLAVFWAIDGGVPMVQLFVEYGADLDAVSPKVR
jgi:ankyrin repeat protein